MAEITRKPTKDRDTGSRTSGGSKKGSINYNLFSKDILKIFAEVSRIMQHHTFVRFDKNNFLQTSKSFAKFKHVKLDEMYSQ